MLACATVVGGACGMPCWVLCRMTTGCTISCDKKANRGVSEQHVTGIGNVIVGVIRCGTEAEARSTESEAPRSETGEQEAEDQPYGGPRMDRQYT